MCAALSLVAGWTSLASAQRVLGVGEDATVIPRGAARISGLGAWSTYNELYGPGGKLEQLGAPLSPDSLGIAQLEILQPLQTSLRTLALQPTEPANGAESHLDSTNESARIGAEA